MQLSGQCVIVFGTLVGREDLSASLKLRAALFEFCGIGSVITPLVWTCMETVPEKWEIVVAARFPIKVDMSSLAIC